MANAMTLPLPPALANDARFKVLGQIALEAFQIDLTPLMVYLVDAVDVSVLPFLAEQFSLIGDGWEFAPTEAAQRAMLRAAIEIHQHKGTPWSIKQMLALIGYPNSELVEYRDYYQQWTDVGGKVLDGNWHTDGTVALYPSSGGDIRRLALSHWADYAIRVQVGDSAWTPDQQRNIRSMAERYAPVRCRLRGLLARAVITFDAGIRFTDARQHGRTRFDRCRRFTAHRWQTLDGCWLLDDGYADSRLDGSWALNDERALSGVIPAGTPIDSGISTFSARVRSRFALSAAGGDRITDPKPLAPVQPLDGSLQLDGRTLDGHWPLDGAVALDYAMLSTMGLRRLDGSWHLGRIPGNNGIWFSAVATTRRYGVTTREAL